MVLSEFAKTYIKEQSLKESPNEACGVFYIPEKEFVPLPHACKNISENKTSFFTIDPNDYLQASLKGRVLAFYHSHPGDGSFSDFDKINAENTKLVSILYSIQDDTFSEYKPIGYELPYLNRQFVVGFIDCYTLIRDYYLKELNINIPDIDHPYRFIDDRANHPENNQIYLDLLNHFLNNDFVEVKEVKKHDVILMKTPKIPSPIHCMIYRGDNQVLHHPFKQLSIVEPYGKALKRWTTNIVRHKSSI